MSSRSLHRAPALVPLSRDHHEALVQALWLRRRAGQAAAARAFLDFNRDELEGHMADEEDVILPVSDPIDGPGSKRIREEHARLRALSQVLDTAVEAGEEIAPTMEALSTLLHDHVRYEEREFFMGLQAVLSPGAMTAMGEALEAHRTARGVAPGCRIRPPR